MDRTVPAGAALLLDFIYRTDAGAPPPKCYETIFGNRQSRLSKPITTMTLGDLIDAQKNWSSKAWVKANWGYDTASSASGAAQFMRDTLIGLAKELSLLGNQVFDADLQDRLAYHLLKRRGYEDFMAGKISRTEFGKRLAMEWASFPVLTVCKGAHRQLNRGQSYYAGDGLNKALVKPEKVEAVLDEVLKLRSLSAGPISGAPSLDTPIPGAIQPEKPKAPPVTAPAPQAPSGSIAAPPPRTTGKTAAAAGIFAIIALTLATWWPHVEQFIASLF